ncbi:ferredoxin [Sedimentitalea sp. XS_ASV28]|uniref:ferredoxin n=1 Tax=Sedimentitalea sp. XS_ASV28 TaxID=3241296 RepID=UPI003517710B
MHGPDATASDQATVLERLGHDLIEFGLLLMGAAHPSRVSLQDLSDGTLILLGCGPDFWQAFTASPEAKDGRADPVDRWSLRVVTRLADRYGAVAYFPFGGPPYAPFINWATRSGRSHSSPTGMLVHDTVGLMISFRGALHFPTELPLPDCADETPCNTCSARPCTTACPVGALSDTHPYDLATCHAYLDTVAGQDCMQNGCAARRACPISAGANRLPAQSALHMKAFHPK